MYKEYTPPKITLKVLNEKHAYDIRYIINYREQIKLNTSDAPFSESKFHKARENVIKSLFPNFDMMNEPRHIYTNKQPS